MGLSGSFGQENEKMIILVKTVAKAEPAKLSLPLLPEPRSDY